MQIFAKNISKKGSSNSLFPKHGDSPFFGIQTKLVGGNPEDKYEREADNIAEKVLAKNQPQNKFSSNKPFFPPSTKPLQTAKQPKEGSAQKEPLANAITPITEFPIGNRKKTSGSKKDISINKNQSREEENSEKEVERLQKKSQAAVDKKEVQSSTEEQEILQAKASAPILPDHTLSSALQQSKGGGNRLSPSIRMKMEYGFGADFHNVRIHTGSTATTLNRKLGAKAFTSENDIFFNSGMFDPNSLEGQKLLAHELTHTIQQGTAQPATHLESSTLGAAHSIAEEEAGTQRIAPADKTSKPILQQEETSTGSTELLPQKSHVIYSGKKEASEPDHLVVEATQPKEKRTVPTSEIPRLETPRSPETDPNFQAVKARLQHTASTQQSHPSSQTLAHKAQEAAPSPPNERMSLAQASQVEVMENAKAEEFNAEAFKERLMQRIENMKLPINQEEAAEFDKNNNLNEINTRATQDILIEKTNSIQPMAQTSQENPDANAIPQRETVPLMPLPIGNPPASVHTASAMPSARGNSEVVQPLEDNLSEVDLKMRENEITEQQLAKSKEPAFLSSLQSVGQARKHTQTAPMAFRQGEQNKLGHAKIKASENEKSGLLGLYAQRASLFGQVAGQQKETTGKDASQREKIASDIDHIYQETQKKVHTLLDNLNVAVNTLFTRGAEEAKKKFEVYVERKMDAYKERRYSGATGKALWVKDKFLGIPDEVNKFFREGRNLYIAQMDIVISEVANVVANRLNEAKLEITLGRQKITNYVTALPENLRQIGDAAACEISGKFDKLEDSVHSKQDELIDSLAQQYMDSLSEVDGRIEEMKAANKGLVDLALSAVNGVIETIGQLKKLISDLLAEISSILTIIMADPIGFVANLFIGIKQGFNNFTTNILTHLMAGFVQWLTGTLGPLGIAIPEDIFSLKGIFSLVMQVLGLTWDYVRQKAVKHLGEPTVKAMEFGVEIFQIIRTEGIIGLWEYIKGEFADLKETIIGSIQNLLIVQVIQAGIKWLASLLIPGAGFIKAILAIKDLIVFFVESAMMLIPTLIQAIQAMAANSIAWVADVVEKGLASMIPVVIRLFARIIGLGGLAKKVQKIIEKIRKRIDKAIDKVILKAKKAFKKLLQKGKAKVKGAVKGITEWWKARRQFKGNDNKKHTLFLESSGNSHALMLASKPTTYTEFISSLEIDPKDLKMQTTKNKAKDLAREIDLKIKGPTKGNSKEEKKKNEENKQKALEDLMEKLVPKTAKLLGLPETLPKSVIKHTSKTTEGNTLGTSMDAKILSKKGDNGSSPTRSAHTIFDELLKRKEGGRSYYVRGHLLNEKLHGPGNWRNLTPLSQKGNSEHLSMAEKLAKIAVNSGSVISYNVTANYGRKIKGITSNKQLEDAGIPQDQWENTKAVRNMEKHVPLSLTAKADLIKPEGKDWVKVKTLIDRVPIPNEVDTRLASYSTITGERKKTIGIKSAPLKDLIVAAKDVDEHLLPTIKDAALKLPGKITRFDHIKQNLINADGYKDNLKSAYGEAIAKLQQNTYIKLN